MSTESGYRNIIYDWFGNVEGEEKLDRGWLTSESIIQLKIFNAPFKWNHRDQKHLVYAKITPINIQNESSSFGFTEVTNIASGNHLEQQPQFGCPCGNNDLVIFHMTVTDPANTVFLVDLYSSRYEHVGYIYVMPNAFENSGGTLDIPIICATKHRPLGLIHLGYLHIKPFAHYSTFSMATTFQRYWNPKWTGLDVGHRGSGSSFKSTDVTIRENTIASFKNAVAHGADLIEFDVQLSKDLVPVIYHDFNVYISPKAEDNFIKLPMQELTFDELRTFKVYHTTEGKTGEERIFYNDHLQENQPFPQLTEVLDAIDLNVGFNIEIKWAQKLKDGSMEGQLETVVDRNLYIDCILETVFRKSKKRRIVFSCFDADICNMLRYKQNRFPVMFLTFVGSNREEENYKDGRCTTAATTICNAVVMELLGVVVHTENLLRNPIQVLFSF